MSRVFAVPSETLGRVEDVMPERIGFAQNDWASVTRDILKKKKDAAAKGAFHPPHPIDESLRPATADACPAMGELESFGLLLKWPATAILREVQPKGWEIKPSSNFNFFTYSPLTSFPETGEAESILVDAGFTIVTPPGWSILVKNAPNQLAPRDLVFAEAVVRADQATFPLRIHAMIRTSKKEIRVKRGDPMLAVFAFKREPVDYEVVTDPALIEECARLAQVDKTTFENAPGGYRRLYMDDDNPSPLYPKLSKP